MTKRQVAAALEEIALLMEMEEENPFKIRSYVNGARALEGLDEDIELVVKEKRLREIKGVGAALEAKIEEMVTTGKIEYLENLRAKFPPSLYELMRIPALGPKRVKILYEQFGIDSREKLENACKENKLKAIKGFGDKMQQKILDSACFSDQHATENLFHRALQPGMEMLSYLEKEKAVIRIELAGSLRRRKELIKDIDIVASSKEPAKVMKRFLEAPQVSQVTNQGDTKSSVILDSNITCDLRVVTDEQFPYALHYFTGSKEHNVGARQRAKKRKLKLNEYGLFDVDEKLVKCADETAIFKALGMPYIQPEIRENQGEFDIKKTPKLIEQSDMRGVIHCHTDWSDGVNTLEEMALGAQERGYEYIVISDHSQTAAYAGGLKPERVLAQHAEIEALNKRLKGFRVLKGIESDIRVNGDLDYEEDILKLFDVIIGSPHNKLNMEEKEATARMVRAMENPYLTVLGHPTGRLLMKRAGNPLDFEKIFDAAAANGVAVEINCDTRRMDVDWRHVKRGKEKGCKFSLGPDAHSVETIHNIFFGIGLARKGWLEKKDVIGTMTAKELMAWKK